MYTIEFITLHYYDNMFEIPSDFDGNLLHGHFLNLA